MKKILQILLSMLLTLSLLACERKHTPNLKLENLKIGFAPTMNPASLYNAAEPLGKLIQQGLVSEGFEVEQVTVSIAPSNDALIQGLQEGDINIAVVPSASYGESADVKVRPILVGLSEAQELVADGIEDIYKEQLPELQGDYVSYTRGLIYVNTQTATGKEIYSKAVDGTLSYGDLYALKWAVGAPSSEGSYIYPSRWISDRFGEGKNITTLKNVTAYETDYDNFNALLKQEVDVVAGLSDLRAAPTSQNAFRIQYPTLEQIGQSVYDVIKVIGITAPIMNPVFVIYSDNKTLTDELIGSIQQVFISILSDDSAAETLKILGLKGFGPCKASDLEISKAVYRTKENND